MQELHKRIIKEILNEKKKDRKVISILLFGSLARGTATKKSDIDIEIIYDGGEYKEISEYRNRVKVDFEIWPKKKLKERIENYSYLSYPYLEEKILYDPQGFAKNIKSKLKKYFEKNKEARNAWKNWTEEYLKFKNGKIKEKDKEKIKSCKAFYDELELKFSREHKITRDF